MKGKQLSGKLGLITAAVTFAAGIQSTGALAEEVEWSGFAENATYHRKDVGISKSRTGLQLEGLKFIGDVGPFRNVSINGVLRLSYDAVYELNDDEFGDKAGGSPTINSLGLANLPAPTAIPINGPGIGPAGGLSVGNFAVINILGPQVDLAVGGDGSGSAFPYQIVLGGNTFVEPRLTSPS